MNAAAVSAAQTEVLTDAAALPADWDALMAGVSPYLGRAYLQALAAAPPPGTRYVFAAVRQGEALVAGAVFQLIALHGGQLPWLEAEGALPVRLFLWLTGRLPLRPRHLLLCGNLLHADAPGFGASPRVHDPAALLHAVAEQVRSHRPERVALTLLKTPDLGAAAGQLESLGYVRTDGAEPTMQLAVDPAWRSGDDYLAAMRSKYRQRARAARKRALGLSTEVLDLAGVEQHADALAGLLAPVLRRADVLLAPIPAETLVALKRGLGDAMRVKVWREDGALVGFSASVRQGDALDGSLVAVTDAANRQHKLYQNALYDFVEEAIAEGVGHLGLGRTALEIKSAVGAEPHPVAIYLRSPNGLLHRLLAYAVARLALPAWTPRHPFAGRDGAAIGAD